MTKIVEDRHGEVLALKGSDCDLSIDSSRGELIFERHALILRSRPRAFRLDALVDLRLRVSERPALTTAMVGKLLGAAFQAMQEGQDFDAERIPASSARQLLLRIRSRNDDGGIDSVEEKLSVEGVVDFTGAVELARKMSSAAGLGAIEFYALPECGIELRLKAGKEPSVSEFSLPEDLDKVPPPPFEVSEFDSIHRVEEWMPGNTVRLHEPLSKGAPFALFFSLLFLAGLGWSVYHAATGDPASRGGYLIIAAFGLVLGGGLGFILSLLLPHTVVFDWSSREIRVATWFRKRVVAFDEIARLELEAKRIEVPSGDSGSNIRFVAVLQAIRRDQTGEGIAAFELVRTKTLRDADDALWMALPLLYGLADALEVEARLVNYLFRTEPK